jgi:hypothetical protein
MKLKKSIHAREDFSTSRRRARRKGSGGFSPRDFLFRSTSNRKKLAARSEAVDRSAKPDGVCVPTSKAELRDFRCSPAMKRSCGVRTARDARPWIASELTLLAMTSAHAFAISRPLPEFCEDHSAS